MLGQWKADQEQLKTRFDLDKDGKIDQKEWVLAHARARRKNPDLSEGVNVLTATGDLRRPYLLSSFRQPELIKRYRLWMILTASASSPPAARRCGCLMLDLGDCGKLVFAVGGKLQAGLNALGV